MKNDILHVAYATDDQYIMFTGISLYSLLENNQAFSDIVIHILDNGLTDEKKDILHDIAQRFGRIIKFYDCSHIGEWLGEKVVQMFERHQFSLTISAYARLFLPELLDPSIHKVIYLDADSIILGSYMALWNQNISHYSVMGVLDIEGDKARESVGMPVNAPYINSGMLVMNLEELREIQFTDRVREFIAKYDGQVYHHDQGVINGLLYETTSILPPQYNMTTAMFDERDYKKLFGIKDYYTKEEMAFARKNPVFVHFTMGFLNRPWTKNCKHPLQTRWIEYKNKTVWKDQPLLEDNRTLKLKLLMWCRLHLPMSITTNILKWLEGL